MKKLIFTSLCLLMSVFTFAQQEVTAVNKTDCPVYFNIIASHNQCTGQNYNVDFFVPGHSTMTQIAATGFEFTAAKASQFDFSQSCSDNVMYVSPSSACINCSTTYPNSDSSYVFNSCACDDALYMEWFTNCSGPTYNNAQIVVYN